MRVFQFLISTLFVVLVSIQPAFAKEFSGVIIALPFSAEKGASEKDVNSSIEQLMKTIRSQPGLLEDKLLVNTNHADRKSFVHVMKWNRLVLAWRGHGDEKRVRLRKLNGLYGPSAHRFLASCCRLLRCPMRHGKVL